MALTKIKTTKMKVKKGAKPIDSYHYLIAPPFNVGEFNLELLVHNDDPKCWMWAEVGYGGNWTVSDLNLQLSAHTIRRMHTVKRTSDDVAQAWCFKLDIYELKEFFHDRLIVCVMCDKHDNPIQAMVRIGNETSIVLDLEKKVRHEYASKDYEFTECVEEIVDVTLVKHEDGTATITTTPLEDMSQN